MFREEVGMRSEHQKQSLLPEIVALCVSAYLSALTVLAVAGSEIDYSGAILAIDAACILLFAALLAFKAFGNRGYPPIKKGNMLFIIVLVSAMSVYLGNVFWNSGYHSLFATDALFSGESHIDTLFHASISESIKNYGVPSVLLNDTKYFPYHYGSHAILAAIAAALGLPAYIVYNYLYPVFFGPLFFLVFLNLILDVKRMNGSIQALTPFDLLITFAGLVGVLPSSILARIGIWNSNIFISESFLIGLIALFVFLRISISAWSKGFFSGAGFRYSFFAVLTPLFIFICSASKISIGFLLFCAVSYLLFRTGRRGLAVYIFLLEYAAVFFLCYRMFSGVQSETVRGSGAIELFSYLRRNVAVDAWFWYFALAYCPSFYYIWRGLHGRRELRQAIKRKELLKEEALFLTCLLGAVPGLLLKIDGGSAMYFSMVQGVLILPFLVGDGLLAVPPRECAPAQFICSLLALNVLVGSSALGKGDGVSFVGSVVTRRIIRSERYVDGVTKGEWITRMKQGKIMPVVAESLSVCFSPLRPSPNQRLKSILDDVNEMTRYSKRETGIYIDPSSELWAIFKDRKASPFFITSYTGLALFGAVYSNGDTLRDGGGGYLGSSRETLGYGLDRFLATPRTGLSECLETARRNGLRTLVIVTDSGLRIASTYR
jgi:hypothetical protein